MDKEKSPKSSYIRQLIHANFFVNLIEQSEKEIIQKEKRNIKNVPDAIDKIITIDESDKIIKNENEFNGHLTTSANLIAERKNRKIRHIDKENESIEIEIEEELFNSKKGIVSDRKSAISQYSSPVTRDVKQIKSVEKNAHKSSINGANDDEKVKIKLNGSTTRVMAIEAAEVAVNNCASTIAATTSKDERLIIKNRTGVTFSKFRNADKFNHRSFRTRRGSPKNQESISMVESELIFDGEDASVNSSKSRPLNSRESAVESAKVIAIKRANSQLNISLGRSEAIEPFSLDAKHELKLHAEAGDAAGNREIDLLTEKLLPLYVPTPAEAKISNQRLTRRNIRNIFLQTNKFQKTLKTGTYVMALVHQGDRMLVTGDDFPPTFEVPTSHCSPANSFKLDLNWIIKVTNNWEVCNSSRLFLDKLLNVSDATNFRRNILQTIFKLQRFLELDDLGKISLIQLPHLSYDCFVIIFVKSIENGKNAGCPYTKWTSIHKLENLISAGINNYHTKKSSPVNDDNLKNTLTIVHEIPHLIEFDKRAYKKLDKGLYLMYLKTFCSISDIEILASSCTPNSLPYYKIRIDSKVTEEEKSVLCNETKFNDAKSFKIQLYGALKNLIKKFSIPTDEAAGLRFYSKEVFSLDDEVGAIVVFPSVELVCSGPGEKLYTLDGTRSIPLQIFEILHWKTYNCEFLDKFCQLSNSIDLSLSSIHNKMQQLKQTEENLTRQTAASRQLEERLREVCDIRKESSEVWCKMRWVARLVQEARDKSTSSCHYAFNQQDTCVYL